MLGRAMARLPVTSTSTGNTEVPRDPPSLHLRPQVPRNLAASRPPVTTRMASPLRPCCNGCGRPAFGGHRTCCRGCNGDDRSHSHDCAAKAKAAALHASGFNSGIETEVDEPEETSQKARTGTALAERDWQLVHAPPKEGCVHALPFEQPFPIGRTMEPPSLWVYDDVAVFTGRAGHVAVESQGEDPTSVRRAGSETWQQLHRGMTFELLAGDQVHLQGGEVLEVRAGPRVDEGVAADASGGHMNRTADVPAEFGEADEGAGVDAAGEADEADVFAQYRHDAQSRHAPFASPSRPSLPAPPSSGTPSTSAPRSSKSRSNKEEGAWMYPDFKIRRAPSVYINGRKYVDPKSLPEELPRREQQSNFRLTIGTNKTIEPELRAEADAAFESGFGCVKEGLRDGSCLTFGPKDAETFGSDRAEDVITDVAFHAKTEVGEIKRRLHAHPIVKMKHYSQVHLHTRSIMAAFKKGYNRSLEEAKPREGGDWLSSRSYAGRVALLQIKPDKQPYVQVELLQGDGFDDRMTRYAFKDNQEDCPL